MTDREFVIELRRGLIIIIRACIVRYGLAWDWFRPRTETLIVSQSRNTSLLGIVDNAP